MKIISFLLFFLFSNISYAKIVTGAGATFPFPVYSKWAAAYEKETGIKINYQSVGSVFYIYNEVPGIQKRS